MPPTLTDFRRQAPGRQAKPATGGHLNISQLLLHTLLLASGCCCCGCRRKGCRRAEDRVMRLEGSYCSSSSSRLMKCWCSGCCDSMYFWRRHRPKADGHIDRRTCVCLFHVSFFFISSLKVCTCVSSPLAVCTWPSRGARPWSTRSSPDGPAENTFVF